MTNPNPIFALSFHAEAEVVRADSAESEDEDK